VYETYAVEEKKMDCTSETITKMIESLPKGLQDRVLEEIKPIISEALDEAEWQTQFERSQKELVSIARKVKREIKAGRSEPMDYEKLRSKLIRYLPSGKHMRSFPKN
jgi:hypothetical protein